MTMDLEAIYNKYKPSFEYYNIKVYGSKPHEDIRLTKWWMDLSSSGDINDLITPESHSLRSFLDVYRPPTILFYRLNSFNEIDSVFWIVPIAGCITSPKAYVGLWCSPGIRGTSLHLNFVALVYSISFEFYHALMGFTWQKELLEEHEKLGYTMCGVIPNMYDKEYVYIVHLKKEDFFNSRLYNLYRRKVQRS